MTKEQFNQILHERKYLYSYLVLPIGHTAVVSSLEPYMKIINLGEMGNYEYMVYRFHCENVTCTSTVIWRGRYFTNIYENHLGDHFSIELTKNGEIFLRNFLFKNKPPVARFMFKNDFISHLEKEKGANIVTIQEFAIQIEKMRNKNMFMDVIHKRLNFDI